MITRIDYESDDSRRSATVFYIRRKRWHVLVRILDPRLKPTYSRACYRESLTSAQGCARTWVSR